MENVDVVIGSAAETANKATIVIKEDVNQVDVTLMNVKDQALSTLVEFKESIKNVRPFISGLVQLAKYRLTLSLPIHLRSNRKNNLFDCFVWAAICILTLGLGEFLGHNAATVMHSVITKFMAQILAIIVLPVIFYHSVKEHGPEHKRFSLVVMSFFMGVCSGYAMAGYKMEVGLPPHWFIPLVMAVVTQFLPSKELSRGMYIGSLVSACFTTNFMIGIVSKQVDGAFFTELLITLIFGIFNIQMTVATSKDSKTTEGVYCILVWVMSIQILDYIVVYLLTGSDREEEERKSDM